MVSHDTFENDAHFNLDNVYDALKVGAVIYRNGNPIDMYTKYIFLDEIPFGALEKRKTLLLQAQRDETNKYPPTWYFVTAELSLEEKWELQDNYDLIVVLEEPSCPIRIN
ncbi:TPA: hypothetical protein EYP66_07580 [Candidatus Poribacteria bacterium]|nr:hypothetical protein [Candidatus Poribacteria bacterium]